MTTVPTLARGEVDEPGTVKSIDSPYPVTAHQDISGDIVHQPTELVPDQTLGSAEILKRPPVVPAYARGIRTIAEPERSIMRGTELRNRIFPQSVCFAVGEEGNRVILGLSIRGPKPQHTIGVFIYGQNRIGG